MQSFLLLRQAVHDKELTLPVAVDVEDNELKPMSTIDLTNLTAYALEQVEKMGFYAQLYTYTGYKYELDMARLSSRWDVWLARLHWQDPEGGFLSTTPTSTPARAMYRASPATLTST